MSQQIEILSLNVQTSEIIKTRVISTIQNVTPPSRPPTRRHTHTLTHIRTHARTRSLTHTHTHTNAQQKATTRRNDYDSGSGGTVEYASVKSFGEFLFPSNYPSIMVKYMVMDKSNPTVELCRKYFELRDCCLLVVFVSLLSNMTAPDIDALFVLFCFFFLLFFSFFFINCW